MSAPLISASDHSINIAQKSRCSSRWKELSGRGSPLDLKQSSRHQASRQSSADPDCTNPRQSITSHAARGPAPWPCHGALGPILAWHGSILPLLIPVTRLSTPEPPPDDAGTAVMAVSRRGLPPRPDHVLHRRAACGPHIHDSLTAVSRSSSTPAPSSYVLPCYAQIFAVLTVAAISAFAADTIHGDIVPAEGRSADGAGGAHRELLSQAPGFTAAMASSAAAGSHKAARLAARGTKVVKCSPSPHGFFLSFQPALIV